MAKIKSGNKFDLYRYKIILITGILFLSASVVHAQKRKKDVNLVNYDERLLHYGFTLGVNSTSLNIRHSDYFTETDTLRAVMPGWSPGFSLGFILNVKAADFLDVRLLPTVSFYERSVDYTFNDGTSSVQTTESTFIEVPVMAKFKGRRRRNFRMYLVGGIKPAIEAGAKKNDKKPTQLRTENIDFSIEYGFGIDYYFELFKFAPEIRFSHGIANMLVNDPNAYANSINRMTTHTVSLYLHFE